TMSVQEAAPAPAAKPRARRRAPVTAIVPFTLAPTPLAPMGMTEAAAALEMASAELQSLSMQAPVMTSIAPMAMVAPQLAAAAYELRAAPIALAWGFDPSDDVDEPDWTAADKVQGDAADSVYRAARQALNDNNYDRAAELFKSLRDKYPRSSHVPNTYYWQAFALYRAGSEDQLRTARAALQTQARRYPNATTRRDAEALLRRVEGSLAQLGDEDATASTIAAGDVVVPPVAAQPGQPAQPPQPAVAPTPRPGRSRSSDSRCDDDDDDIRIAALNAVLQMDADRAVPLLKTVLARRDEGSACLRRKAVFLVSQKRSDETSRILLNAVRTDPDKEVREQAVFWLSQVPGEETVAALDSILQDPKSDPEIQEKAIFALSQHRSPRAAAILCTYSGRRDRPAELREKSIFWLGQRHSAENQQCLRDLYKSLDTDDLKEKVIFSLSQMGGADNYRWLMDIALNTREPMELRKKALFWAGQARSVDIADLVRLYDSMNDREMKEQLIFVYSQRREEAAIEKLCQIGKNDPDVELRKKALFWLGQSRSQRAMECLTEVINK
ncbi:MAG TPA: HEAT repeat domain-containing protein, partial [Gemmatimonadales bacterium]|nr:HEAT repeat domain-containing protein [Gemmatimonadales bacterium]